MVTPIYPLRISLEIKDAWKEASKNLDYSTLSEFIIDTINKRILSNTDKVSELNEEVIETKDKQLHIKKLSSLQKANRSEAFEVPRYIKNILRRYHHEENFIDEGYLLRDLKLQIEKAKVWDCAEKMLLNLIPEFKNKGWQNGLNLITTELISLGISKTEIEKHSNFNENNIGFKKIKQKNKIPKKW